MNVFGMNKLYLTPAVSIRYIASEFYSLLAFSTLESMKSLNLPPLMQYSSFGGIQAPVSK
jgi:hypothetical protein